MISKVPGSLTPEAFDSLIEAYIEQEDAHAVSLSVLAELDAQAGGTEETVDFELIVRMVKGQLDLVPLTASGEFEVRGNEVILADGRRVVVQVKPPAAT